MNNEITDFPIEDGSRVSDHIKNQPRKVSIEGVISSYDLPEVPVPFDLNRAELAYQALEKLFTDRLPVDIETSIKLYPGMGIESIEVKRDVDTGEALYFSLTAKEIKRTTLFKTQILNVARAPRIESKAQKKVDTGKQEIKASWAVTDATTVNNIKLGAPGTDKFIASIVGGKPL
jgi:hypothetical protein